MQTSYDEIADWYDDIYCADSPVHALTVPALLGSAANQSSCALRVTSMNSLQIISPPLAPPR